MKVKIKLDLLAILGLLFLINVPLLFGVTPIAWDTFKAPFEEFSVTYNSVYFSNQLPLWLPFSSYGIPNYFWLASLSIVNFLWIGIGKLFQIQNALLLFNLSLFCEQLVAALGMYLLAGKLFAKKTTVFITCLAFVTTFVVYRQVQLNFRLTYLLPWILFWIVMFFKQKSPVYIWLTGITLIFSVPGSAFYPLVIEFYAVAIFALVLFVAEPRVIKNLWNFSWQNLASFACLLVVGLVFAYYFKTFSVGVGLMREGRGADLNVPVGTYLTYWGVWNPIAFIGSLFYGFASAPITNGLEYNFYIGFLPLAGVVAAFLYQRKAAWYAVLLPSLFLYAISVRGYLAFAAYYLPFIDITRYIAILGTIPFRFFLVLAAGMGLDQDLSLSEWKKVGLWMLGLAVALDMAGLITSVNAGSQTAFMEIIANSSDYRFEFKIFLLRIVAYLAFFVLIEIITRWNKGTWPAKIRLSQVINIGLLLLVLLDVASFRFIFESKISDRLSPKNVNVALLPGLTPPVYQDQRLPAPLDERLSAADGATLEFQSINGWLMESYLQFDRCVPAAVQTSEKYEMFTASQGPLIEMNLALLSPKNAAPELKQLYGCEYPKLRVLSNILVSPSDQAALTEIANGSDFSNLLVLSGANSQRQTALYQSAPRADIRVVDFSTNHIRIEVDVDQENSWLVYSDLYDSEWRAAVNGKAEKIERAYLAFKAVPLRPGQNSVEFHYGSPLKHFAYSVLAILCGAAAFFLLSGLFLVLFFDLRAIKFLRR